MYVIADVPCHPLGARWSSGINAANGARGPRFASRKLPTVCDLGQVVNLSLFVA